MKNLGVGTRGSRAKKQPIFAPTLCKIPLIFSCFLTNFRHNLTISLTLKPLQFCYFPLIFTHTICARTGSYCTSQQQGCSALSCRYLAASDIDKQGLPLHIPAKINKKPILTTSLSFPKIPPHGEYSMARSNYNPINIYFSCILKYLLFRCRSKLVPTYLTDSHPQDLSGQSLYCTNTPQNSFRVYEK